ncbi:MAG: VWA-like domain-containing protein, partial [Gemmiger sp.]
YGCMPLIEPLETRESKKIRDFVIVLDTSESTSGTLVKNFLKETFGLLKSGESFFRRCRILVLQCDDAVRGEAWLHDLDALERYAARLTLTGGGGTDFRPAFDRIGQLLREGKLTDLQGVLYFTDGKGIYPARRPPFETAFLFLDDGTPPPEVPPWAMRLVLEPEEFLPPQAPERSWLEPEEMPAL